MNQDITHLVKQIRKDIINYLKIHSIETTRDKIEEAVNQVINMSGISLGEEGYIHQDIIDAIDNIIKK